MGRKKYSKFVLAVLVIIGIVCANFSADFCAYAGDIVSEEQDSGSSAAISEDTSSQVTVSGPESLQSMPDTAPASADQAGEESISGDVPETDTLQSVSPRRISSAGDCLLTGVSISEKIDGLAPFDADNEPGNDSGAANNIVRSFDDIYYTLSYVTAIKGNTPVSSAKLMVKMTLPCRKETAQFNLDAMQWMQDAVLNENTDGTQTLTGFRMLQNTDGETVIPGAGTLSAGIEIKAAANGTEISPEFELYIDGAADEEKVCLTDTTKVSAAPKYNIRLIRNEKCSYYGYFDLDSGTFSQTKGDGMHLGRMYGYGVAVSLYNETASKKLKGVELPAGDISFDIRTVQKINGVKAEDTESGISCVLWDYRENHLPDPDTRGKLGRRMWISSAGSGCCPWLLPGNSWSIDGFNNTSDSRCKDLAQSCFDGGTWSIQRIRKKQVCTMLRSGSMHLTLRTGYSRWTGSTIHFTSSSQIMSDLFQRDICSS